MQKYLLGCAGKRVILEWAKQLGIVNTAKAIEYGSVAKSSQLEVHWGLVRWAKKVSHRSVNMAIAGDGLKHGLLGKRMS